MLETASAIFELLESILVVGKGQGLPLAGIAVSSSISVSFTSWLWSLIESLLLSLLLNTAAFALVHVVYSRDQCLQPVDCCFRDVFSVYSHCAQGSMLHQPLHHDVLCSVCALATVCLFVDPFVFFFFFLDWVQAIVPYFKCIQVSYCTSICYINT